MPPDLSTCTRIEVHYPYGGLGYFLPDGALQKTILSTEEKEYVRSCETWVVNDQALIKAFAQDLNQATYRGYQRGRPASSGVGMICYCDTKRVALFTVYHETVITDNGYEFECPRGLPRLRILEPPRIQALRLRYVCATHLCSLYVDRFSRFVKATAHPEASQWCDSIVAGLRNEYTINDDEGGLKKRSYSDTTIAQMFRCPGVPAPIDRNASWAQPSDAKPSNEPTALWRSNYAINPNCRRDSPPDTVLLFETKPGWNQHGGPELFTFDNHDPRGGLVLLNDGTVKFIRTKEELKQLRWE
jgi:hypothetical protein